MLILGLFLRLHSVCLGLDLLQEILSLLSSSGHFVEKLKRWYFLWTFPCLKFLPTVLSLFVKSRLNTFSSGADSQLFLTTKEKEKKLIYFLCTGAYLYAPYRLLLISNKFWMGSFLGPKWHSPIGSMPFHRAQKTLHFQGLTPSHLPT